MAPVPGRIAALCVGIAVAHGAPAADDPLPVTTRSFAEVAEPIVRSAPAEVVALARTRVAARLAAPVASLPANVGDRVAAGDVVARLDCTDFRDRLEGAEARLDELQARRRLAQTRLERARRLRAEDAVSADRLDEARAEFDALAAGIRAQQSNVTTSRRDVERCTVTAPFAGTIVARPAEPGSFVQPGTPLVELVDPDDIVLSARLAGSDAEALGPDMPARFHAGGREYPVRLLQLVPLADTAARTREARLRFADARPLPGRAGRLRWAAVATSVPADLVVRREPGLGVMLLDGGRARFHPLPDAVEGRRAPADLAPDTRLIVQGRHAAIDGQHVRPVE